MFLLLIAVYISFRFEWRMALTAILAMIHDVLVSIGIYSVFGFEVTPATVVAFLTVLGYSLYDSIVVFDRIRDNERRVASSGLTAGDLVNISTNQVLLRSINTTMASALPVISLLLIGAGALRPGDAARVRHRPARRHAHRCLLVDLRGVPAARLAEGPVGDVRRARLGPGDHLVGEDLRAVVIAGPGGVRSVSGRRRRATAGARQAPRGMTPAALRRRSRPTSSPAPADRLLSHPPRPRKKKRR